MDCTVHGILQARTLEWVAIPAPGDLPNPGIKPRCPTLQADSLPAEPPGKQCGTRAWLESLMERTEIPRIDLTHVEICYLVKMTSKFSVEKIDF